MTNALIAIHFTQTVSWRENTEKKREEQFIRVQVSSGSLTGSDITQTLRRRLPAERSALIHFIESDRLDLFSFDEAMLTVTL